MIGHKVWSVVCRAAETDVAKVVGVIAATLSVLSASVAVLWAVASGVGPPLWEFACFLYYNPAWLLLAPICLPVCLMLLLVFLAIVATILGFEGGGCTSLEDYPDLRACIKSV